MSFIISSLLRFIKQLSFLSCVPFNNFILSFRPFSSHSTYFFLTTYLLYTFYLLELPNPFRSLPIPLSSLPNYLISSDTSIYSYPSLTILSSSPFECFSLIPNKSPIYFYSHFLKIGHSFYCNFSEDIHI